MGTNRAQWNDVTENWVAWVNDDEFGVGLYTPDVYSILTGKVGSDVYDGAISKAGGTTYTAMISRMRLRNFIPLNYTYYLAVGNVAGIRQSFYNLSKTAENREIVEARERG